LDTARYYRALSLNHSSKENATSNTIGRSKKAAIPVGMLLHLVSIGFACAVTIVLFGVASVSLLGTGRGIHTKILPTLPPQGASISETSKVSAVKLLLPDDSASVTKSGISDAGQIPSAPNTKTQSAEVGGPEQAATGRRLIADGVSATPDASLRTVLSEIPDEGRDLVSRNVQIQQNRPATLDPDDKDADEKAPAQKVQDQRVNRHLLNPNAAFRYRVQKECGPIIFPALYRHCVASFGVHHR
jgi:hypothetical protein